jgi:hypothetical protein
MAHLLGFPGPSAEYLEVLGASKDKLFSRVERSQMKHSAEWNYYADKIKKGESWTRGWS